MQESIFKLLGLFSVVDVPYVRIADILWSNINQILYLTTWPSFQVIRIVAECNLNVK